MATETVRAIVLAFLLSHGYGDHTQAVLQYIQAESGFQPCVESRRGHFLMQWVGVRVKAIHRFAGPGCPRLEAQLEFFDTEMHSGLYERFWRAPAIAAAHIFHRTFGMGKRR